jgi:hypothetical protein
VNSFERMTLYFTLALFEKSQLNFKEHYLQD